MITAGSGRGVWPGSGHEPPYFAQTEGGHTAIGCFILPRCDAIGFMPDTHIAIAVADLLGKGGPSGQVQMVFVARVRFQLIKGTPILHNDARRHRMAQETEVGVGRQLAHHAEHP